MIMPSGLTDEALAISSCKTPPTYSPPTGVDSAMRRP